MIRRDVYRTIRRSTIDSDPNLIKVPGWSLKPSGELHEAVVIQKGISLCKGDTIRKNGVKTMLTFQIGTKAAAEDMLVDKGEHVTSHDEEDRHRI